MPRDCRRGESVLERLVKLIASGELQQGEKLVQQKLARRLETSQATIRESLVRLEPMGLVELVPQCGARVAVITPHLIFQAFQVREALECVAARLSARQLQKEPKQIERLTSCLADELRWHVELAQLSGNRALAMMLTENRIIARVLVLSSGRNCKIEHSAIIKALSEGNADLAELRMHDHFRGKMEQFKEDLIERVDIPVWNDFLT